MHFHLADALTGTLGPTAEPVKWKFDDPLTGAGVGSLTLAVPQDPADREDLRLALTAEAQVLPRLDDGTWLHWGGPRAEGVPKPDQDGQIEVRWSDWRGWHYLAALRDGDYLRADVEQATAFRDLAVKATDATIEATDDRTGPGTPVIVVDTLPATGVTRQVTIRRWAPIGEALDNLSKRDDSIEWWTDIAPLSDARKVQPRTRFAYPQRFTDPAPLRLALDEHGGNIVDYTPPDSQAKVSRVIALGAGSPPDQLWASDDDPDLADGDTLLREIVTHHSQVSKRATLYDHAASERDALGRPETMQVTLTGTDPQVGTYHVGDRAAVLIDDGWNQIDVPAARIIHGHYEGEGHMCTKAVLTLDLADSALTASEIADV